MAVKPGAPAGGERRFPVTRTPFAAQDGVLLTRLTFEDLAGFREDDHLAAFHVFLNSCALIAAKAPPLRKGHAASAALEAIAHEALRQEVRDSAKARRFFEAHFRPFRVAAQSTAPSAPGFLTGYYEPFVEGSRTRGREFTAPVLARPDNLDSVTPYPDRAAIEAGAIHRHTVPVVWLRDAVEVFLIQVQGSARVRLPDGKILRLVYAGRNGQPYTSIGRKLIESGEIAEADMSLAALKHWVRAHGQKPGEAGLALMHQNRSYVFFAREEGGGRDGGPIGGQGTGLTALRSIAIDRTLWPYGLPFWIAADLPWRGSCASPFRRLMIAQDTGSAILGPGRVDIFFGSGDDAGARAGDIRHSGEVIVFLPAAEDGTGDWP